VRVTKQGCKARSERPPCSVQIRALADDGTAIIIAVAEVAIFAERRSTGQCLLRIAMRFSVGTALQILRLLLLHWTKIQFRSSVRFGQVPKRERDGIGGRQVSDGS